VIFCKSSPLCDMEYIEYTLTGFGPVDPEIVMAQLAALGFDSFTESADGIQAYIPRPLFNPQEVEDYLVGLKNDSGIGYTSLIIPDQNWNAVWESAYEPVIVGGICMIRAPFHPPVAGMTYDIVIEPKMSFGTAHHATTAMMIELLMAEKLTGCQVLDMGCGTGVLAILAHKMGARQVIAMDNDDWAYRNACENALTNGADSVEVIQGDATAIPGDDYDLIVANINRNVLLHDIPFYVQALRQGGTLLMSGFYEDDLPAIRELASLSGAGYASHRLCDQWVGVKFIS